MHDNFDKTVPFNRLFNNKQWPLKTGNPNIIHAVQHELCLKT